MIPQFRHGCGLIKATVSHHIFDMFGVSDFDGRVFSRLENDHVRQLALLDGTQIIFHPQVGGPMHGGTAEGIHRAHTSLNKAP